MYSRMVASSLPTVDLPVPDPTGLAVAGDVVYVGARAAGVLVFDVHEPSAPRLVGSVGDPNPSDTLAVSVVAGPVVAGPFAYLLETHQEQRTGRVTEHFVVLDVHNPLAPVRRGTVPLYGVTGEQVLNSKLDLSPAKYEFGPNPVPPVPVPGTTKFA